MFKMLKEIKIQRTVTRFRKKRKRTVQKMTREDNMKKNQIETLNKRR